MILEFGWIIDRLREKKFRIAGQIADSLLSLWRTGTNAMTVYGQMTKSLKSQIDESEPLPIVEDGTQENEV